MVVPNIFFMGHSYPFSQTAVVQGPRGQILHFLAARVQTANALAPAADLVNILFRLQTTMFYFPRDFLHFFFFKFYFNAPVHAPSVLMSRKVDCLKCQIISIKFAKILRWLLKYTQSDHTYNILSYGKNVGYLNIFTNNYIYNLLIRLWFRSFVDL